MAANKNSDRESQNDRTRISYRPVGAVVCSECDQRRQSGGRLRLYDEGAVKPRYDGLVCELCKLKLTEDV